MKKTIAILALVLLIPAAAAAQGNSFNFQGRLNDGTSPANGSYDLQFRLYDAILGGNQIGLLVSRPTTTLVNGVFSVTLDFGAAAFNNPNSIFIEIAVKPAGSPNAYTILGPRQQLTVVPYAVRAMNATNADNATNALNAQNATNATNANHANSSDSSNIATTAVTANNAINLGGLPVSSFARVNFANQGFLQASGDLVIDGNARQPVASNGFVKAMVEVVSSTVIRCYNGTTNSSSGNCGFTVTQPLGIGIGVYRIDFGFAIADRFFAVTPKYDSAALTNQPHNYSADYRVFDNHNLEIFTFAGGSANDTHDAAFMVIVY
jgi:hypothetical protein